MGTQGDERRTGLRTGPSAVRYGSPVDDDSPVASRDLGARIVATLGEPGALNCSRSLRGRMQIGPP
jgi:hypothetical protein